MAVRYALVQIDDDGVARVIIEAANYDFEDTSTAEDQVVRFIDIKPYTDDELAFIDATGAVPQSYATQRLVPAGLTLAAIGMDLSGDMCATESVPLAWPSDMTVSLAECTAFAHSHGGMYAVVLYDAVTGVVHGKWLGDSEAEVCESDRVEVN